VQTGGTIQEPPVRVGGTVVVINQGGLILAFEAESGHSRWELDTPATLWEGSLTNTFDAVLVGGQNGRLLALGAKSGIEQWDINLDAEVMAPPLVDRYVVFAATSLDDSNPSKGAKFYALNASTGEVLWAFESRDHSLANPSRGGEAVYFGGSQATQARIYALSAAEGNPLWTAPVGGGSLVGLHATEQVVALLVGGGLLLGWDAQGGDLLWRNEVGEETSWLVGWKDHLFTGSVGTQVQAWDVTSGDPLWQHQLPQAVIGAPHPYAGQLLFLLADGFVVALDPSQGDELWRFPSGIPAPTGMSVAQGWLYLVDQQGGLYAFSSP
jgi:outer membrane protein assembly factor BamB